MKKHPQIIETKIISIVAKYSLKCTNQVRSKSASAESYGFVMMATGCYQITDTQKQLRTWGVVSWLQTYLQILHLGKQL